MQNDKKNPPPPRVELDANDLEFIEKYCAANPKAERAEVIARLTMAKMVTVELMLTDEKQIAKMLAMFISGRIRIADGTPTAAFLITELVGAEARADALKVARPSEVSVVVEYPEGAFKVVCTRDKAGKGK